MGWIRPVIVSVVASTLIASSIPLTIDRFTRTGQWPSNVGSAAAATTPSLSTFALSTGAIGTGLRINPPHGGQIGETQLSIIVLRDDTRPGQAITRVTDDRTGDAWTPAGVVPLTNGLIVAAFWHRLTVSGLDSHTYNLAVPAPFGTGIGNYVVWVFRVLNAGDFDTSTSSSTQVGASLTVAQPDFTPAADGELLISVAGYLSDLVSSLSRPSGSDPTFFGSGQVNSGVGQRRPGSAIHVAAGTGGQPIGPRTMTATTPVARASVLVFGVKPQGPSPDFGTAFAYTFGTGIHSAFSRDPVNLGTGSFTVQANDLALPGRVLGFSFDRWYNSADPIAGALGPGWTHSFNWSLTDAGNSVEVRRGDGRRDVFIRDPDGTYTGPPSVFDTLTREADGSWTLTHTSQVRYRFSVAGRLQTIAEPAGNQVTLAYTGSSVTSIIDTVGRSATLSYDGSGRLVRLQDPLGRATTYAYDTAGRLVTVTDRVGNGPGPAAAHQWRYAYDADTRHIRTITDPDGRVRVANTYDAQGRVVEQRDALGARTTMAYSSGQTVVTDPRGHQTTYTFDSRLRVLSQTDQIGGQTLTLSYTYDTAGNRTSVTDRRGKRTDFTYDGRGNVTSKTDPSPDGFSPRPVTTFAYDGKNNLSAITDAAGFTTTFAYDGSTNVLLAVARQVDASTSARTTYEYGDAADPGMPSRVTSPRGNAGAAPDPAFATALAYDARGNLVRRADADGAVTTFAYDAVGRLVSFVDPDGNAPGGIPAEHTWQIAYDELDRETSRIDPLGGALRYAYDGAGNRTSLTDRNGNVTTYAYDANARLATVQQAPDPVGNPTLVHTTAVARDANGNATRVTQGNGVATDYAYDVLDRLVSVTTHPTPALDLVTTYALDGNGQPTSRTTGDGVAVAYSYDDLSRLTAVSGPALSITYAYDAVGRRTRMTDATGVTTYQYDGLGRVTQIATPAGTLGYGYDLDGDRTGLVYPGGDAVSYAYSPGGRLETVTDWAGRTSTYTYTASGLVASLAFPDARTPAGAPGRDPLFVTSYAYDPAQRLVAIEAGGAGRPLFTERYTLDGEGNRTRRDETQVGVPPTSTAYAYDGLSRLLAADRTLGPRRPLSSETFALDGASNVLSRTGPVATYTYDGANRLLSDGTRAFAWAGADRLSSRGTDLFTYDPLGRLTAATVGGATVAYAYDGDGLLRSRTQGTATTAYLWDAATAPAPLLQAGAERVVHGLGPLYRALSDGSYRVLVRDGLGSVRAEVDPSGAPRGAYDYLSYGEPRGAPYEEPPLLGFTGELRDGVTSLLYLRARWYDPGTGRSMSRDPYGGQPSVPQSLNRFAYGQARPTFFTDPLGLDVQTGNWAYDVASVFRDLDSSDRATQLAAFAKLSVVAVAFAVPVGVAIAPVLVGAAPVAAQVAGGVYLLRDPLTQVIVRTGRSIDLVRREAEHFRNAVTRGYRFEVVYRTNDPAAQRGLEHMLYEANPGAFLNLIRPVALDNPKLATYVDAAARFLGGGR